MYTQLIAAASTNFLAAIGFIRLPTHVRAAIGSGSARGLAALSPFVGRLVGILMVCHGTLSRTGFWQTFRPDLFRYP